jgi:hypothetical protein
MPNAVAEEAAVAVQVVAEEAVASLAAAEVAVAVAQAGDFPAAVAVLHVSQLVAATWVAADVNLLEVPTQVQAVNQWVQLIRGANLWEVLTQA